MLYYIFHATKQAATLLSVQIAIKEALMVEDFLEDWLANAYDGMSRRQFLARMTAAGVGLAGFAVAAKSIAGEIITTPASGLKVTEGTVTSGGFQVPIYEARPATPGKYPVVIVIPEIFGMHERIRDVVRRFAREGISCHHLRAVCPRRGVLLHLTELYW